MTKGPAFFTGETDKTPPPSRFTPLASQSKSRVVPNAAKTHGSSSTPARPSAQLNQSRMSLSRRMPSKVDFANQDDNTPKSSLTAASMSMRESIGKKMVCVSPISEERGTISGKQASAQVQNHSIQIAKLQQQVEELTKANRRLTEINDQQTTTINDIANVVMEQKIALQKMEMLGTVLSALVPAPSSLAYFRTSPDSVIVSWESGQSTFACDFEISLNGVPSGRVNGKSRRAILTPLDPKQQYRVSLQAVSEIDDVRSTKVELLIPRLQDESGNKEDADESMGEDMNMR